ncbi:MAG TPA: hypothetical protein VLS96_04960 [Nodosilinea sp.]|nr:hypothetical protein [Nodosilinea sp.]
MTDTTASSASPDPQRPEPFTSSGDRPDQGTFEAGTGWETVSFPGQLPLAGESEVSLDPVADATISNAAAPGGPETSALEPELYPQAESAEPAPENLVQLIQDLNQCNDALLLRVTELEDDLERSQVALQAEVERHQSQSGRLPADSLPGPVQQQIAQLLSELDIANDGLRRTTIHNETLQAELEASQQRVAQLERECTLLQQRFGEKNTALHQAEETCRDLKARLHRQQRYTLQFKAALEKCLNMAPGSATASDPEVIQGQLLPALKESGQPVAMPRSQQIQPWSAGKTTLTDNPSLTHLLRGLRSSEPPVPPMPAPAPEPALAPIVFADLPAAAPTPAPDPWLEEPPAPAAQASLFTEPSPWGEPVTAPAPAERPDPRPTVQPPAPVQPPASVQPPAPMQTPAVRHTPVEPPPMASAPSPLPSYLIGNASAKASPSPLVYPLRSQKKITSIAAVELPSFGRTLRRR